MIAHRAGAARIESALAGCLYAIPLTVSWTVAGVHMAIGLAAALALVLGAVWRRWPLVRTPADAPFAAFALAALVSALTALPATSDLVPLKKLLLIPIVHLGAGTLCSQRRLRLGLRFFVGAIALTALVSSSLYLLQQHAVGDRLRATTHYMTLSGLLLLAWPMAIAAAASRGTARSRLLYAGAAAALTVALVLTYTRSTWLAMPIAATAMLARRRPRALWLVPLLTGLALLVLPPAYRSRLRTSFDPTHHSNADRLEMWQTGLAMWKARPWTGVGIGDLQPVYAEYAPHEVQRIYGHLHNNWVHVLATMGAIGVLAFGWLMLQCGRIVHRAGFALADPELRALALGGWGGFWGFQTMGLFEWNFGDVEVTIAFYFLLGLFAAMSRSRQG